VLMYVAYFFTFYPSELCGYISMVIIVIIFLSAGALETVISLCVKSIDYC